MPPWHLNCIKSRHKGDCMNKQHTTSAGKKVILGLALAIGLVATTAQAADIGFRKTESAPIRVDGKVGGIGIKPSDPGSLGILAAKKHGLGITPDIAWLAIIDATLDTAKLEETQEKLNAEVMEHAKELAAKLSRGEDLTLDEIGFLGWIGMSQRVDTVEKAVKEIGFSVKGLGFEPKPQY